MRLRLETTARAIILWSGLLFSAPCAAQVAAEDPLEQLRAAELQELMQADGESAALVYRDLAGDTELPSALRVRAAYRLAMLERRRGNLQLAVRWLEQVQSLAPEGDPSRNQAERLLAHVRRDTGETVAHNWHLTLSDNAEIRAGNLRLLTDLASSDADTRARAHSEVRARGTLALPALRGALRSASGDYRAVLVHAAVEAGDWSYLGELASHESEAPFGQVLAEVARWPPHRSARLLQYLDGEPVQLRDLGAGPRAWLELSAGRHRVLPSEAPLAGFDETSLEVLVQRPAVVQALRDGLLLSNASLPWSVAQKLIHAGAAEIPEPVLRRFYRSYPRQVFTELNRPATAGLLARLIDSEGNPRSASIRLGENQRDWHVSSRQVDDPHVVLAWLKSAPSAATHNEWARAFRLARASPDTLQTLEGVVQHLWKLDPWGQLQTQGEWITAEAQPPPAATRACWDRLLEHCPRPWLAQLVEWLGPDLPWLPESLPRVLAGLADPGFLTGNPGVDSRVHNDLVTVLQRILPMDVNAHATLDEAQRRTLQRFREAQLAALVRDFTDALRATLDVEPKTPGATAEWWWQNCQGKRSWMQKVRDPFLRKKLESHHPFVAPQEIPGLFEDPMALGYLGLLPSSGRNGRDWLHELCETELSVPALAVPLLAREFLGRYHLHVPPDAPPATAGPAELEVWLDAVPAPRSRRSRRPRRGRQRRPAEEQSQQTLVAVARLLRTAIEDPALPPELRAIAFEALPVASLDALHSIVGAMPEKRLLRTLRRSAQSGNDTPPPPWPGAPPSSTPRLWLLALPLEHRVPALRILADSQNAALVQHAVLAVSSLPPRAVVPEEERIRWLLTWITLAPRDNANAVLATLARRDLPGTATAIQTVAGRSPPGQPVPQGAQEAATRLLLPVSPDAPPPPVLQRIEYWQRVARERTQQ